MAATAAAPASATPATMAMHWDYNYISSTNNPNVSANDRARWSLAISQLIVEMDKNFGASNLIESLSDAAPANYAEFFVHRANETRLLQFILVRLPSLANSDRITVSSTPGNNRCISISISGEAPTFLATQTPSPATPSSAASAATKTST